MEARSKSKAPALALVLLLVGSLAASAAFPPELVDMERRIERFPATKGEGSESERLKQLFDLNWRVRLLAYPEFATYRGHPRL